MRLRAEQLALCAPIEGQPGVIHQPARGELWTLARQGASVTASTVRWWVLVAIAL